MDAFGKENHLRVLAEAVSQYSMTFELQSVITCLKENFLWRNTEKVVLLQVKERLDTNYYEVQD